MCLFFSSKFKNCTNCLCTFGTIRWVFFSQKTQNDPDSAPPKRSWQCGSLQNKSTFFSPRISMIPDSGPGAPTIPVSGPWGFGSRWPPLLWCRGAFLLFFSIAPPAWHFSYSQVRNRAAPRPDSMSVAGFRFSLYQLCAPSPCVTCGI